MYQVRPHKYYFCTHNTVHVCVVCVRVCARACVCVFEYVCVVLVKSMMVRDEELKHELNAPDHSSCTFRMASDSGNFMVGVTDILHYVLDTHFYNTQYLLAALPDTGVQNVTASEKTDHFAPMQFVQYGPKVLQRSRSRDFAISMS